MHPSARLKGARDSRLNGNRIILCVTGSIAAVETVKLARELIRHGAEVVPVMSAKAQRIVSPDALEFACGVRPVTELTGAVEHITLFGEGRKHMVLVAPATADAISKISMGIADDALTTVCLNALGLGVPMVIAPAMGRSMLNNPFLSRNMERLRRQGVAVLPSFIDEDEAKILDSTYIMETAARTFSAGLLKGRNVLVVGGASEEPIDDIRVISSRSSGRTAAEIASAAFEEKASVSVWCGRVTEEMPSYVRCSQFGSISGLISMAKGKKFDIVIVPASLSDFIPLRKKGKIPSGEGALSLDLEPAPKFIDSIRKRCNMLVAFKAGAGSEKELLEDARKRMRAGGIDIIVANNVADVSRDTTRAHIITASSVETVAGSKRELAVALVRAVAKTGGRGRRPRSPP